MLFLPLVMSLSCHGRTLALRMMRIMSWRSSTEMILRLRMPKMGNWNSTGVVGRGFSMERPIVLSENLWFLTKSNIFGWIQEQHLEEDNTS